VFFFVLLANIKVLGIDYCWDICPFTDEPDNKQKFTLFDGGFTTLFDGEDCVALVYRFNVLNAIYCNLKTIGYVCEKDSKLIHRYLIHVDGPIN